VTGVVPTNGHISTPRWDLRQCELLNVFVPCAPGSRVISASMGGELLVALQLEVAHHFIERCAGGRTRRFEPPTTFGATKTTKTLLLNPYQLPAHGCLCCCVPTNTHLLSRDETFWFAINGSFRSGGLPDCTRKPFTQFWGKCLQRMAEVYMRPFVWSVGHPTYMTKLCSSECVISALRLK